VYVSISSKRKISLKRKLKIIKYIEISYFYNAKKMGLFFIFFEGCIAKLLGISITGRGKRESDLESGIRLVSKDQMIRKLRRYYRVCSINEKNYLTS